MNTGRSTAVWWISPTQLTLFVIAPLYIWAASSTAVVARAGTGSPADFVTPELISLGLLSLVLIALGAFLGAASKFRSASLVDVSDDRWRIALRSVGYTSLASYCLFLLPLISQPDAAIAMLMGSRGASADLRLILARIPGVTSLMQFAIPFFSLYILRGALQVRGHSREFRLLFWTLILLTAARAFFASERLALMELGAAILLPLSLMRVKRRRIWAVFPLVGLVSAFGMFSIFEYFRTWPYYSASFDSFSTFAIARFIAYFASSINNGAGLVELYSGSGTSFTFQSLVKGQIVDDDSNAMEEFLANYATEEFNNPGGLFVPYVDFGLLIGALVFLIVGYISGVFFRQLRRCELLGVLIYPMMFVGLADAIRVFYWGSTRTLPIFLAAAIVCVIMRPNRRGIACG